MTDAQQQKLDAIRDGVGEAFANLINWSRDQSTMSAIQTGVHDAFEEWLDAHTDQLIEAIARNKETPA